MSMKSGKSNGSKGSKKVKFEGDEQGSQGAGGNASKSIPGTFLGLRTGQGRVVDTSIREI